MKGYRLIILWLGLIGVIDAIALVSSGGVSDLQALLQPIDQNWPSMVLVLIYQEHNQDQVKQLSKIRKQFQKLSQREAYTSYLDFQELDLAQTSEADRQELQKLLGKRANLHSQPILAAFVNQKLQGVLLERDLTSSSHLRQFIDQSFGVEMARLRRQERAKIKRIVRYEPRPSFYAAFDFGSPFYYSSPGWWGRGYPYWPTYGGHYWW